MNGGRRMRNGILWLAGAAVLAGCGGGGGGGGMEVPGFLGREGNAQGEFNIRSKELPDPVAMPVQQAVAERALSGVIIRVSGVAPSEGYWGAALHPLGDGPDENGVLGFEFVAYPPAEPRMAGAPQTRTMTAGAFVPTITAREVKSVRIGGVDGIRTLGLPVIPKA